MIVVEDLDVVIKHIPWHVNWIEAVSPRVEGRGPEVHSQGLLLIHECDCGVRARNMSDFHSVDGPTDVVWSPGHLVRVPVSVWLEVMSVVV